MDYKAYIIELQLRSMYSLLRGLETSHIYLKLSHDRNLLSRHQGYLSKIYPIT